MMYVNDLAAGVVNSSRAKPTPSLERDGNR